MAAGNRSSSPTSDWMRCPPPVTKLKNPQKTMPWAILAALVTVTLVYVVVTVAALGAQPCRISQARKSAWPPSSIASPQATTGARYWQPGQ